MIKTLFFECKLLSDIILTLNSATEGNSPTLDFIPGINFLGITARKYQEFKKEQLDYILFHSGHIRFGDAHIAINGKRTLRIPCSWFTEKGKKFQDNGKLLIDNIFVENLSTAGKSSSVIEKKNQLQQIRCGYFTIQADSVIPSTNYSIKSAYDIKTRRSKEGEMFGYQAIRQGNTFIFPIDICLDDESQYNILKEKIIFALTGNHAIGRSRSAQYGHVSIRLLDNYIEQFEHGNSLFEDKYLIIYAETPLLFYSRYGEPALIPTFPDLMIADSRPNQDDYKIKTDDDVICWDKSRIRSRIYAPWNSTRYKRDNDRICIDKGSVLVIDTSKIENFSLEKFKIQCAHGIGFYRNEGMGRVLINPSFLYPDSQSHPVLQKNANVTLFSENRKLLSYFVVNDSTDEKIKNWLNRELKHKLTEQEVLENVTDFIKAYGEKKEWQELTASQWGQIRAIAQAATSYHEMYTNIFDENEGFVRQGIAAPQWKNCHLILENAIDRMKEKMPLQFTILLSSEMAKRATQNKTGGDYA